jgi:outer membrane protein assembly factor BamB
MKKFDYVGSAIGASPVPVDGQNLVFAYTTVSHTQPPTPVGTVQSINMESGKVNWTFTGGTIFHTTPAIANGTIYLGNDDGNLYAINLETGQQKWALKLGGKLDLRSIFDQGTGFVFTGDFDGNFYAVDLVTQTLKWSFHYPNPVSEATLMSPAVISGGAVFTGVGINNPSAPPQGFVYAFNASTGATLWTTNLNSPMSAPLGFGDGLIFVGCYDNTVRALDQNTGTEVWRFSMGAEILGQPGYDNGWVYCGSMDGSLYARATHPPPLTTSEYIVPVNDAITSGVAISNATAFFGARDASMNGFFYALPVAQVKHNPVPLTKAVPGGLLWVPIIASDRIAFSTGGFTAGTLYMFDVNKIDAPPSGTTTPPSAATTTATPAPAQPDTSEETDSQSMSAKAHFTSQLIVDQYDVSGATAAPSTPAFQMMLSLYDENKAPQTASKVNVWASDPLTITAGGQTYSIGTDQNSPTVLPASAAGQLTMTTPAVLGMTSLFLQPDFFKDGFYQTTLPHYDNFQTLSNLQASDLDPATALGYDGQPILPASYQDVNSRTALASSISNTVGRQQQPSSKVTMVTPTADPPSGGYQPGAVPSFTVDLNNGITFTPNSSAETIAALGPQPGITGISLGFDDFINNIINGAEGIASIVWQFANSVVTAIVNGVEHVYNFVVQTTAQAVQVAAGIFKQVVGDVDKVLQWLSYLFSWSDIVATHTTIKTQVMSTIGDFQTWLGNELKQTTNDVDTFFNNAENNAVTLFDQLITKLGSKTVSGVQAIGGDPNAAFTVGGQDITTQANWLPRKLAQNAPSTTVSSLTASVTADVDPISAIGQFFTNAATQIGNDPNLQSLPSDCVTALKSFGQLFTGSTGFTGQTIADVLAVVRDLIAGLIHVGKVFADAFMELLQSIFNGIVTAFTNPIQIPFLSDFYQAIANAPLSLLDLFCLIVAVPTTIVYKAINGTAPGVGITAGITTAQELLGVANTFTLLLLMPLWIAADLAGFPPIVLGVIAAASLAQMVLSLVLMMLSNNATAPDYVLWTMQLFSVILAFEGAKGGTLNAETLPTLYGVYGFGLMIIYSLLAALESKKYWDPDGEPFFNNLCSMLPYMGQPLSYIKAYNIGPTAVALLDAVGFGVSSALSTILFWDVGESAAHA